MRYCLAALIVAVAGCSSPRQQTVPVWDEQAAQERAERQADEQEREDAELAERRRVNALEVQRALGLSDLETHAYEGMTLEESEQFSLLAPGQRRPFLARVNDRLASASR